MRLPHLSINEDVQMNEVVSIKDTAPLNKVFLLNGTASLDQDTSLKTVFSLIESGLLNEATLSSKVFSLNQASSVKQDYQSFWGCPMKQYLIIKYLSNEAKSILKNVTTLSNKTALLNKSVPLYEAVSLNAQSMDQTAEHIGKKFTFTPKTL